MPRFFASDAEGGQYSSMSLRDWFAGQVVSGLVQRSSGAAATAKSAYAIADALLVEREKTRLDQTDPQHVCDDSCPANDYHYRTGAPIATRLRS